ncbi:YjgF-like protein [Apiospora phragmitis]|uniref:YjgF-like protein n=1 Tax=Apiospora phragmitis TaxID=2905665 RepID=A0ABR1TAT5_9PEZI
MSPTEKVLTSKAPKPLPQFSQAVKYNGMVYCSGSIGFDPATSSLVEGGVKEQTRRALQNLTAVLEAAGSSFDNMVKVNVFLTTMDNFAAMNEAYDEFFKQEVKPVSKPRRSV